VELPKRAPKRDPLAVARRGRPRPFRQKPRTLNPPHTAKAGGFLAHAA
jgi:hypothetical protein